MVETDQFVPLVNCRNLVPPVRFEPLNPGAITVNNLPGPDFVFMSSSQEMLLAWIKPSDDQTVLNILDTLKQLVACEPCHVIAAFAEYIFQPEFYVDGLRSRPHQESSAISPFPRDRQVRTETAAKDHVIHLETITLAKEQEAPTANAVGQILTSSRELWKRWKSKLLSSLSRYSRNGSMLGSLIFVNAAQASSY